MTSTSGRSKGSVPPGFFSAVPQERVAALGHATSVLRKVLMTGYSWPTMSPGSLNAWLIFLGASPGGSPRLPWNYDPLPSIGVAHGGVAEYVDGKGFWNGIREYARTIFPELYPADAYAATMVRNLVPEQSATAPTGKRVSAAALHATEVLGELIRPRLVIAIGSARKHTDRVFRKLPDAIEADSGILHTSKSRLTLEWFSLAASWESGDEFLYVSPKGIHPSRRQVSREDTLEFLCQQSEVARAL